MKFAQLLLKPLWNLVLDHEYSFSACNVNFYMGLIPVIQGYRDIFPFPAPIPSGV